MIKKIIAAIQSIVRSAALAGVALASMAGPAFAAYDVNIPPPGTPVAAQIYSLHTTILVVCVVIFVVVFGAMVVSLIRFRKSVGAKAEQWHENTAVEIIWTIIPFFILLGMAYPATRTVLDMKDTSNPDMTIKVTAYQWKWSYEYLNDGVFYYSQLSTPRDQIEEQAGKGATKNVNYLLEVDNELVVPVGKRVRLLITSSDVIHGWYMPTLGVNQYGIPGFIKDAWIQVDAPGIHRGQCSQICGKEHGYMPIVVRALNDKDYQDWLVKAKKSWGTTAALDSATTVLSAIGAPASAALPVNAKILFDSGKTNLPADMAQLIAASVDFAKTNAGTKLFISGFTDKTGDPLKNEALAKERAKAVREALKAAGLAEDAIEMRKPEAITGGSNNDDARRVEVGVVPVAVQTVKLDDANKKYDAAELKTKGEQLYAANCAACHQTTGMGVAGAFPALNGSKVVQGPKAEQIAMLMNGKAGSAMASFARLSDLELASVATYTRMAWGNKASEIQPADFKAARK